MGYKFKSRTARLQFDDTTPFSGAEVVLNLNVPMEILFKFMEFGEAELNMTTEDRRKTFREFGDRVIVEWNLQYDDDTPIPANGNGLIEQPGGFGFAGVLLKMWVQASNADELPLDQQSNDGRQLVAQLPEKEY